MAEKYKVRVLRDVCIGAANCIAVAPDAFELDEEQIAVIKDSWKNVPDDKLLEAAKSCPVAAIIVEDKEGRQVFPEQ